MPSTCVLKNFGGFNAYDVYPVTYDNLITNGTVIDGTGAPAKRADIGIGDGKIVEVGPVSGKARRTIDAEGLVVAPGFIDPHTHYDAQICWDGGMTPSSWHGVTSVVMGNCGVGIAPCRPQAREIAMRDRSEERRVGKECRS